MMLHKYDDEEGILSSLWRDSAQNPEPGFVSLLQYYPINEEEGLSRRLAVAVDKYAVVNNKHTTFR